MKNHYKKQLIACSCILSLTGVTFLGPMMPSVLNKEILAADGDVSSDDHMRNADKVITHNYPAASVGETLHYDLNGYSETDIISSKWYVDDVLRSESTAASGYTIAEDEDESFISYEVKTSDGKVYTGRFYCSSLPVLYIDSSAAYDSFQYKTEDYTEVSLHLTGSGYEDDTLYSGDAGIRLRGNSTAGLSKKPFKLKLDKKSDLLGMGEQKHWVLLANAIDSTNMRNKLLYDFSAKIGAETSMQSENITMIYNGEYMGVYQLCEQVRVGKNRVEIYNWEDAAEDVADVFLKQLQAEGYLTKNERKEISSDVEDELNANYDWLSANHTFTSPTLAKISSAFSGEIDLSDYVDFEELDLPDATGGALIEMDFYTGASADLLTSYKQPFYFDTPENGRTYTALYNYMKEYIQTIEYALHDTDFIYNNSDMHYQNTNEGFYDWWQGKRIDTQYTPDTEFTSSYDGMHYSELLDMDSAVVNFLVCEFSRNWDSMKNSVFLYKDIDSKLVIGPAWDFDWAFGNSMYGIDTNYPTGWQTTDEYFANEQYYQTVQWNRYFIRDPYFLQRVYEKYQEIRPTVIEDFIKDGGVLDTYYENYKHASLANDEKWGGSMGSFYGAGYESEFNRMKEFITTRVAWLDKQFSTLETFRLSTNYYITSSSIKVSDVDTSHTGYTQITASCTNKKAAKVSFQINGCYIASADLNNGTASITVPDNVLTAKKNQSNLVQVRAMDASGNYISNARGSVTGEYQNCISNYSVFAKELPLILTDTSDYLLQTSEDFQALEQIAENTSISDIKENFATTELRFLDTQNQEVSDETAKVCTGWKVQRIINNEVSDEAVIIISGDINCDGKINVLDMEIIQKSLLKLSDISDISLYAALSATGNSELSIYEMEWIQKYLLGL